MFLSKMDFDSSPGGNGHDGVKIMTVVTMDGAAVFYFRKQSRL